MLKSILTIYLSILTVIAFGQSPGKVAASLQWWFKANAGASLDQSAQQVDSWLNNGGFNIKITNRSTLSSAGYPKFFAGGMNFNPVIRFSADQPSVFQTAPTSRANMGPLAGSSSVFAVFRSTQKAGSIDNNVFYYTPNILSTETGVSKRDYALGFVEGKVAVKCDTIDDWVVNTNKLYNNAVPQIAVAVRARHTVAGNPAAVQLLINGRSEQNTNTVNTSYLLNSSDYFFSTVYYGLSIGALTDQRQTAINTYTAFDGDIAELIVYDRVLADPELVQVNSYLAVKYGITLDQSQPYSYLRSDGVTVWDAGRFGNFNHDIAGIGKDAGSDLAQVKSKSVNWSAMITLSDPSDLNNNEFLMCSDNGLELTLDTLDVTPELRGRSNKMWQIQETGETGTVSMGVDLSNFQPSIKVENMVLVINERQTFKSGKKRIVKPSSISGNVASFENISFDNDTARYFAIGELKALKAEVPLKKPIVYQLISPNNDGFNDSMFIENIELYPVNDLSVFNTEGNLVYSKSNYQNGVWDCSRIIDGNYYYVLNIAGEKLSGHLVVKR